jgi:hypothetical protein
LISDCFSHSGFSLNGPVTITGRPWLLKSIVEDESRAEGSKGTTGG